MEQEQLQIFIKTVIDYFTKIAGSSVEVGVPYLKDNTKRVILSHTGVIGISGKMQGAIYITAEKNFLVDLLNNIMPGTNITDEKIADMAGELANTIAGNAQQTLGRNFNISIPMILTRDKNDGTSSFELKAPTFIVPFKWKEHQAFLVVGLI